MVQFNISLAMSLAHSDDDVILTLVASSRTNDLKISHLVGYIHDVVQEMADASPIKLGARFWE